MTPTVRANSTPARPGTLGIGSPRIPTDLLSTIPAFRQVGTTLTSSTTRNGHAYSIVATTLRYNGELLPDRVELSVDGEVVPESEARGVYRALDLIVCDGCDQFVSELSEAHRMEGLES